MDKIEIKWQTGKRVMLSRKFVLIQGTSLKLFVHLVHFKYIIFMSIMLAKLYLLDRQMSQLVFPRRRKLEISFL